MQCTLSHDLTTHWPDVFVPPLPQAVLSARFDRGYDDEDDAERDDVDGTGDPPTLFPMVPSTMQSQFAVINKVVNSRR